MFLILDFTINFKIKTHPPPLLFAPFRYIGRRRASDTPTFCLLQKKSLILH